jgi:hypothetical protein
MTQYLFLHIPRTSGTTFMQILSPYITPVAPWENWRHYLCGKQEIAQSNLFGGHVDYNATKLFEHMPRTMTIIRNPIDRAVSHYNHMRRNQKILPSMSFEEFIEDKETRLLVSNLQTRMIGSNYMPGIYQTMTQNEISSFMERRIYTLPEDLLRAKLRLQSHLFFFGLKERQVDSYRIFNALTGLDIPCPGEHHRKYALSRKITNRLQDLNEMDLELYEYAYQLFEEICLSI